MRQIFELWSPHFVADDALVLDVTPANLPEIDQPPEEWINGCLAAAGVRAAAREWSVRPFWCNYYSNFPDSEDWQDRWRITWTIGVTLREPARRPSRVFTLPAFFDQHDPSWKMEDEDERRDAAAILFVAPAADAARVAGEVDAIAGELRALGRETVEKSTHAYDDGWVEGRITFSAARLASDAAPLDAIIERLRGSGFVTNWNELMGAQRP